MKRGFTVLELLIVIAIIGVLATIVIMNMIDARARGRDARKIEDIRQIVNALELYYSDHKVYPNRAQFRQTTGANPPMKKYIWPVPKSPTSGEFYLYAALGVGSDCNGYHLSTSLERDNAVLYTDSDFNSRPTTVSKCTLGGGYSSNGRDISSSPPVTTPGFIYTYDIRK